MDDVDLLELRSRFARRRFGDAVKRRGFQSPEPGEEIQEGGQPIADESAYVWGPKVWRKVPLAVANVLGPRIVRYIP